MPQVAKETVGVVGLAPRERVQQRTAGAPLPQVLEETVDVGRLVLHERVQQRAAEQIEDAPQSPPEVIEAVTLVPREQAPQRTAEKLAKSRPAFAAYWKIALQEPISAGMRNKFSRECLLCGFQLWRYWLILQGVERRRNEAW